MRFTDIFVRRPVLAIVVNLIIVIAGLQAIRTLNVRQYPQARERDGHRAHGVRRRQRRSGARLHHHAARARPSPPPTASTTSSRRACRGSRRSTCACKLNFNAAARARRHQRAREPGARRSAARGRGARDQHRAVGRRRSRDVPELRLDDPRGQPGHRLPDPRRAAAALGDRGRAARRHPRRPHLRDPRLAQARPHGGARTSARRRCAQALGRQQLPVGRRPDQGRARPAQPHGRRPTSNRSTSSSRLVIRQAGRRARAPGGRRRRRARRRHLRAGRAHVRARRAVFMGVWVLPNANSLDVIARVRKEIDDDQERAADGHARPAIAFDSTKYINSAIHEVRAHADRDGAHRHRRHLPVPRLAAHGARAARGHPGVAHRRRVPDAGVRLHAEPADAARDRARRSASWSTTPSSSSRTSSGTCATGKTPIEARSLGARELVGPDHRHDHHAGRGVRADRLSGRPHRRAVPRVRLHAGRRGVHLRRRRADALADDVVAAARGRAHEQRLARADRPRVRARSSARYARALAGTLAQRGRRSTSVWIVAVAAGRADVHVLADRAGAERGSGRRLRRARRAAPTPRWSSSRPYTEQVVRRSSSRRPSSTTASRSRSRRGGFGGMLVKPWEERKRSIFPIQEELFGKLTMHHRRARAGVPAAGAAQRGHLPGRVRHRLDGEPRRARALRRSDRQRGRSRAASSPSRRSWTCSIDQAKAEIVIDRDKVASMGLSMQQVGADLSSMLGGNFVNRFNIDGRSYKVIPQIERAGRLTPEQLKDIYITGPNGTLMPLSSIATLQHRRRAAHAEPLPAAQRGQDLRRRAARARTAGSKVLEDAADKVLPPATASTTPASRGSSGRRAASSCPRWAWRSCSSSWCSRRSSTRSATRSSILAGSVPLAMFGAHDLHVPEVLRPAGHATSR